jgi:hypothetical protein
MKDLNCAIKMIQQAVESTPMHHHDRGLHLNNFGLALWNRFQKMAEFEMEDLECTIENMKQAVDQSL